MQVFKTLPEGTLAEVIDNSLYMSPAPSPFHQRIIKKLSFKIDEFVNDHALGEVFISPVDLYLDEEENAVQPDILFISKDNTITIDLDGLHGVPDLIIEVLSPGNEAYDRSKKKELYERFGVREYWIVDPKTKIATGYSLERNRFEKIGEHLSSIDSKILGSSLSF